MIYTLTVNPAIDYVIGVDDFETGVINRTSYEQIYAGGKGLNVSTVLGNLGVDSIALGFVAGPTGDMLESMADRDGLRTDFVKCFDGNTRINVKMKSDDVETEINGRGPLITREDIGKLLGKISSLGKDDLLVVSGSAVSGISYEEICKVATENGAKLALDITGKILLDCLKCKPLLVKPNIHELSDIFGVEIYTDDDVIKYATELQRMGAINVMISIAGDGAILIDANGEVYTCRPPKGNVINSVGAGDTTVAAFIAEYMRQTDSASAIDYGGMLKYSVAAGSATAFKSGLANKDDIEALL